MGALHFYVFKDCHFLLLSFCVLIFESPTSSHSLAYHPVLQLPNVIGNNNLCLFLLSIIR